MSIRKRKKNISRKAPRKQRITEIASTFEWLITAFILAFVFRAFVMEAFRIPTGSMASTLMGAHFRLSCPQCGYKYARGFVPEEYRLPRDTLPASGSQIPRASRCPSCGYYYRTANPVSVENGDRILVLKCLYQFVEPRRWDVVVFKNPLNPQENYIKRLVGLPEESIEIIDGDIYIDGKISQKPQKVQNELWMPVYDNSYQPVKPYERTFNGHQWRQPFDVTDSEWEIDTADTTKFHLDSPPDQINRMSYDSSLGNDFRATYGYNDATKYDYMPYCSDLMMRFYLQPRDSKGLCGIQMSKYKTSYKAWVNLEGRMIIARVGQTGEEILESKAIKPPDTDKPVAVEFANVDHRLVFRFGSETLHYDLGSGPEDAGTRQTDIRPQVKVFGSGKLTLLHVAIFRDIYYTGKIYPNTLRLGRATQGNPFTIGKNQFFVLGDNSPNSEDCRWWNSKGIGNRRSYRKGIVPREYLVGKALLVYWPSGFKLPWPKSVETFLLKNAQHSWPCQILYAVVSLKWIPNIGRLRLIYGGSGGNL